MDASERVAAVLACSAIDPRLACLLFLDLDPTLIYSMARWLVSLLGDDPPVFALGPRLTEEALWERIVPDRDRSGNREGAGFRLAPGPLAGFGRKPGIVLAPDLALLGLPAARAVVSLAGADVVHLERAGRSRTWRPRDRWLAALRRKDAGRISPHLLDRFALRVDAADLALPRNGGPALPPPPAAWSQAVRATRQGVQLPPLSVEAADQVLALIPPGARGARRDLALGRLARALAALAGEPQVLPGAVETAAALIGLGQGARRPVMTGPVAAVPDAPVATGPAWPGDDLDDGFTTINGVPGPARPDGLNAQLPVVDNGEPEPFLPQSVEQQPAEWPEETPPAAGAGPYPEDDAEPQRDIAPLRIGPQRALAGPSRGHPVGIRRALDESDIAVAATLLQAAWAQKRWCPEHYEKQHALHVYPWDLRSYRRAPSPGSLLVLVLDHTCRAQGWDWYEPLAPYLHWAYVARALVGVVEVGAADPGDGELRATAFRARSLLDPRMPAALERPPGRATPLAHGLILAARMLRHDTQHGSAPVGESTLVVVTDGRANVPLAASESGTLPLGSVGRSGVDDALAAARPIRAMRRVRSVLIDPGLEIHGHLAAVLAEALGAQLVHGVEADAVADPGVAVPASGAG